MIKKIVIIGPESTGKSTLCEQLAQHYDTIWCPEFAREYLLTHARPEDRIGRGLTYTFEDLLNIAKGQLALEDEYTIMMNQPLVIPRPDLSGRGTYSPLFIDTDMYVMKVWSEYVFGNCHRFILEQIIERKYDLYLLCNTDLPWVKDELREYPDPIRRYQLYLIYKDIMINQETPWVEIRGDYDNRLRIAVNAVDKLLRE